MMKPKMNSTTVIDDCLELEMMLFQVFDSIENKRLLVFLKKASRFIAP